MYIHRAYTYINKYLLCAIHSDTNYEKLDRPMRRNPKQNDKARSIDDLYPCASDLTTVRVKVSIYLLNRLSLPQLLLTEARLPKGQRERREKLER